MNVRFSSPLSIAVLILWGLYVPFFINRKWLHFEMPEVLNNYFTDLLCIPLVLSSTLVFLQILKKDRNVKLSVLKIIVAVIYFSIVFEWILPANNSIYTADVLDVICYFIGGMLFYMLQRLHFRKLSSV